MQFLFGGHFKIIPDRTKEPLMQKVRGNEGEDRETRREGGQVHRATNGIQTCLQLSESPTHLENKAFMVSNWDVSAFQNSTNTHCSPVPKPSDPTPTWRSGQISAAPGVRPCALGPRFTSARQRASSLCDDECHFDIKGVSV